MKSFTGIWATFKSIENLNNSLQALKEKNIRHITVHSPFILSNIDSSIKPVKNYLKLFSLAGGVSGALLSFYLIIKMSLEWIQPLSAKPIISVLTIIPVAFEITILSTVLFTLFGILIFVFRNILTSSLPQSKIYRTYKRFTRDRFGIVVHCNPSTASELNNIFARNQAEEIFIEE